MSRKKHLDFPDGLRMQDARDLFLAANGFRIQDYSSPTFTLGFFGLKLKFPNTSGRQADVPLHDLHHILTGFGTDWIGEGEIGIWEIRTGCRTFAAYFLNGGGVLIGLLLSPHRVWRAFRAARGKRNLYADSASYDRLLQMTVGQLRARLGLSHA